MRDGDAWETFDANVDADEPAEEEAVHIVSEDAADDVDPAIERADYLGET